MWALHFLLLLGSWSKALASSCPSLYSRFSKSHTYCLSPNTSCSLLINTVTTDQVEEIVRVHNQLRSKIATGKESTGHLPPAKNMMEMKWDEELAAIAQKHADQCLFEHDCRDCRRTGDYYVGQNLLQSWTFSRSPKVNWTSAIHSWYNEVKDFDSSMVPKFGSPRAKGVIGHFTQVAWAKSWRIGCGYAAYPEGKSNMQLYTCNYGPGGNVKDDTVYQPGKTCSDCPFNTCCGDSCKKAFYPGLCRVEGTNIPIFHAETEKYLYFCNFTNTELCNTVQHAEKKTWGIFKTLSGTHTGIILQKGEVSGFEIKTVIQKIPLTCIVIVYRKGPNAAGEESGNEAKVMAKFDGETLFTINLEPDTVEYIAYKMSAGMYSDYMLSVEFKALTGAQYLEIKEISVKEGKC